MFTSHAQIIEAFGGLTSLAKAIKVDPKLATHWGRRGIPAKYWPLVEETRVGRALGISASLLMRLPARAPAPARKCAA